MTLKRVERIELSSLAWKAKVLPLNYTRLAHVTNCSLPNYTLYASFFINKSRKPLPIGGRGT